MATLATRRLYLGYDQKYQVANLNLTVPGGRITALVGPNGSGKSTILKGLARVLKPVRGSVFLDGQETEPGSAAYLPQNPRVPDGITVAELIAAGRMAARGAGAVLTREDRDAVAHVVETMGLFPLIHRPAGSLSGGQRQRALIASCLARGTDLLVLDEPVTGLDPAHQMELLGLLERLNRQQGTTIVMALHDLNHAARYAHHMVVVKNGQVTAEGAPDEVMTPSLLSRVFRIAAAVVTEPRSGRPVYVPYGLVSPA